MQAEFFSQNFELFNHVLFKERHLKLEVPSVELLLIRWSFFLLFLRNFFDDKSAIFFLLHIKVALIVDAIFDVLIKFLILKFTLKSLTKFIEAVVVHNFICDNFSLCLELLKKFPGFCLFSFFKGPFRIQEIWERSLRLLRSESGDIGTITIGAGPQTLYFAPYQRFPWGEKLLIRG